MLFAIFTSCLLLASRPSVAADYHAKPTSPLSEMNAFAFASRSLNYRRSSTHSPLQVQAQAAKKTNPLFDLVFGKKNNGGDIESVQDFDAELARQIQDALFSADVEDFDSVIDITDVIPNGPTKEMTEKTTPPPIQNKAPTPEARPKPTEKITTSPNQIQNKAPAPEVRPKLTEQITTPPIQTQNKAPAPEVRYELTKKITSPPKQNRAPEVRPKLPPHTALAQVVANQYNIDIASVPPLEKGPGGKITAEDVEYHYWMTSQPPCTAEALDLAHSLGMDLNTLYDDEDREYVLELCDVELFVENARSLGMASQIKKGRMVYDNKEELSRKKMKKISALDERVEQNVGKLSNLAMQLAGTVTGNIFQQVQSQVQKIQLVDITGNGNTSEDINAVEDFDLSLASEIEEALSSANAIGEECESDKITEDINAIAESDASFASEIQEATGNIFQEVKSQVQKIQLVDTNSNGKNAKDINAVNDFDLSLASEIQEALSSTNAVDEECESGKITEDINVVAESDASFASETEEALSSANAIDEESENGKIIEDINAIAESDASFVSEIQEATGNIFQQIKSQVQKIQLVDINSNGKNAKDINAVEDFDLSLASEIEEALSSAYAIDEECENGKITEDINAIAESDASPASETEEALSSANAIDEESESGKITEDTNAVTIFDASFVSEIQDALSSIVTIYEGKENDKITDGTNAVEDFDTFLESGIQDTLSSVDSLDYESATDLFTKEDFQSMTCVQLKDELRVRGMKVSGKKAELVDRLCNNEDQGKSPPFFANML